LGTAEVAARRQQVGRQKRSIHLQDGHSSPAGSVGADPPARRKLPPDGEPDLLHHELPITAISAKGAERTAVLHFDSRARARLGLYRLEDGNSGYLTRRLSRGADLVVTEIDCGTVNGCLSLPS